MIITDLSLLGWDTHFQNFTAHGKLTPQDMSLHINILELGAVQYATQYWGPFGQSNSGQQGYNILYKPPKRCKIPVPMCRIWNWCLSHQIEVSATRTTELCSGLPQQAFPSQPEVGAERCHILEDLSILGFPRDNFFATPSNVKCW